MQDFLFYLKLGWEHIISLDALDHQLFILALVAAFSYRNYKNILVLVTAFTIGHSITLALSVLDVFRISPTVVEILIPATIFLTAVDNLIWRNKTKNLMRINYFLALIFGLVHGMGFANTARMMIASEQDLAVPLLGFNIGLELGQILVVGVLFMLFYLLDRFLKVPDRWRITIVSTIVMLFSLQMIVERIAIS